MECKITSTPRNNSCRAGVTLVEMLMGVGVGGLVLAGLMSAGIFTARSFAAMGNYCDLNTAGRSTLDRISKDIRQTDFLSGYTNNLLVFQTTNPNTGVRTTLTYTYNPVAQTLTRTLTGTVGTQSNVLLTNCTYFHYELYQRNPALTNGGDLVVLDPSSVPSVAKAVDLTWICSRSILGVTQNSQDVQSARVVIRKD